MKRYFLLPVFVVMILLGLSCSDQTTTNSDTLNPEVMQNTSPRLRHVVMFRFKPEASSADIEKVEKAFSALPSKISEIKDYEWGTNNSPEGLNHGYTHCFLVTFDSEEDRSVYLPHPAHKAFVEVLQPHLDEAMVLDYWAAHE